MDYTKIKALADVTKDSIADHFISVMDDKYPSIKIQGLSRNAITSLHKQIGHNIRNDYGLWLTTNPLTREFFLDSRANPDLHPCEVSKDIVNTIWCKLNEAWPFYDFSSGGHLVEDRFYAFSDSGGFAGKFYGYDNCLDAAADMKLLGYEDDDWSIKPEDLGSCVAVLTGRQFIDQLYFIHKNEPDSEGESVLPYGYWYDSTKSPANQSLKV